MKSLHSPLHDFVFSRIGSTGLKACALNINAALLCGLTLTFNLTGDFRTYYWKINLSFSQHAPGEQIKYRVAGTAGSHLFSVCPQSIGLDWFHICEFSFCRCRGGPAAAWRWVVAECSQRMMGRCGIDLANEVAYLFPALLACPPGMLRPDGLKATAWDQSLGGAPLLRWTRQDCLCVWLSATSNDSDAFIYPREFCFGRWKALARRFQFSYW